MKIITTPNYISLSNLNIIYFRSFCFQSVSISYGLHAVVISIVPGLVRKWPDVSGVVTTHSSSQMNYYCIETVTLISPARIIRNLNQTYSNSSIYYYEYYYYYDFYYCKIYTTHAFSDCPVAKTSVLKVSGKVTLLQSFLVKPRSFLNLFKWTHRIGGNETSFSSYMKKKNSNN